MTKWPIFLALILVYLILYQFSAGSVIGYIEFHEDLFRQLVTLCENGTLVNS